MNTYWLEILGISPYLLVIFLGLIIDIVLFRRYTYKKKMNDQMRANGVRIPGHITARRKVRAICDLIYAYEIQGQSYSQVQHVDEETFYNAHPGDSVIVCYSPEEPEKSVLQDAFVVYIENQTIVVITIIIAILGLLLLLVAFIAFFSFIVSRI